MNRAEEVNNKIWLEVVKENFNKRPGLFIEDLLDFENEELDKNFSEDLEKWIFIFDEFIAFFLSLTILYEIIVMKSDKNTTKDCAMLSLLGGIVSQSIAIRRLVLAGLDVPSKQVLRSLVEYIDVANLLSLRPELIEEFCCQEFDEANKFWRKYVAKGKARKVISDKISNNNGSLLSDDWIKWKIQEDTILSVSAHPSYVAACMNLIPTISADPHVSWPGYLGIVGPFSVRTLRYCAISMVEYLMYGSFPEFNKIPPDLAEDEFVKNIQKHAESGRFALSGLIAVLHDEGSL